MAAEPSENGDILKRATYASVVVALLLIAVKFGAYLVTGSVSLLSTLLDSLLDAAASLVNLVAVRHALTPPDREHRFGHGKAEPLAALGQSAFVAGSALLLLFEVGSRLVNPQPVTNTGIGIGVMVFAIVVTIGLVSYQRSVIRRTGSLAIRADSLHYFGDLLVNGAVIVALLLASELGWIYVDPIFGAVIAAYILYNAWQIARGAFDMLMDRELSDADRQRIKDIVLAHPEVRQIHDLRTRASGPVSFIQFHLELDGDMSLARAHGIADAVEAEICSRFPGAEVIIHQDPAGLQEERPRYA